MRKLWIPPLAVAAAGIAASHLLWNSGYIEFEAPAKVFSLCCAFIGVVSAAVLFDPLPRFWRLTIVPVIAILLFQPALEINGTIRDRWPIRAGANCLSQIGSGMQQYRQDNHGYFPFDERGPFASLALLYPHYLDDARVFTSVNVRSHWGKRNEGPFFPSGTALEGAKCHYGYTWRVPLNPPGDFAIAADWPTNFMREGHLGGFSVLYADGSVSWRESPFCSHDPHDNIFSPEPGWLADTDSFIR
jgi:prepilin-type processing-associated H-X9-DG protein